MITSSVRLDIKYFNQMAYITRYVSQVHVGVLVRLKREGRHSKNNQYLQAKGFCCGIPSCA
jgi:hypothetical protein